MIVIGLVGIVVPVLPGLILIWAGVAVWALSRHDLAGWLTLGLATLLTVGGSLVKYLLPGRRLRSAGVGWPTLACGAIGGVVGFFVVPVVGLFAGFILGVYLAERYRLASGPATATPPPVGPVGPVGAPGPPAGTAVPTAWESTKAALVAVGWSIAIELATGLMVTTSWLVALVVT